MLKILISSEMLKRLVFIIKLILKKKDLIQPNSEDYFFILGSGRCGSTLLKAILERNTKVIIVPEIGDALIKSATSLSDGGIDNNDEVYKIYMNNPDWGNWGLDDDLSGDSDSHPIDSIYTSYRLKYKPLAKLIGDKNPLLTFHLPVIKVLFPKAKIIHLVRNGYDVVYSWNTSKGLEVPVVDAAKRWNWALKEVERFKFLFKKRIIEVKYEDLIEDTTLEVQRICDFLNIDFSSKMLETKQPILSKEYLKKHHEKSQKKIDKNNSGKGIEKLGNDDLSRIEPILRNRLKKYGY